MKTALVVPTIRKECINNFLDKWLVREFWDEVIVVEDNPEITFDLNLKHHYSWAEIEEDLGEDSWIISRRDSSIRSYGFLVAYREKADIIFTLDDDCLPGDDKFIDAHIKNLTQTPKWIPSIPGQRTRGLPYQNLGIAPDVALSVGLWQGVPDFDAIQTLSGADTNINLPETYVLPMGQFVPICGMNIAFKREFTPAAYFMLQGEGQPFRRFDDIWFGVVAKKIADHLGLMITLGRPYIYHSRASDPMVNLVKEAPGIKFHEKFWEMLDKCPLVADSPARCMEQIGHALSFEEDEFGYAKKLGRAMRTWAGFFTNP